jgi:hypothetical protein
MERVKAFILSFLGLLLMEAKSVRKRVCRSLRLATTPAPAERYKRIRLSHALRVL